VCSRNKHDQAWPRIWNWGGCRPWSLFGDRSGGATLGWCYGEFIVVDQEAILHSPVGCFVSFGKWLCAIGRIFVKTFAVTNGWIWLVASSVHFEMVAFYAPSFIWKCRVSSWVLNGRSWLDTCLGCFYFSRRSIWLKPESYVAVGFAGGWLSPCHDFSWMVSLSCLVLDIPSVLVVLLLMSNWWGNIT
jgi:hypothetical protein